MKEAIDQLPDLPKAGWYDDPADKLTTRFWDGGQWSGDTKLRDPLNNRFWLDEQLEDVKFGTWIGVGFKIIFAWAIAAACAGFLTFMALAILGAGMAAS